MDNQCQLRFRRSSDEFLMREWERLLAMLDDVHLSMRGEVFWVLENSGKITTRSLYRHLSFNLEELRMQVCVIWGCRASLKVQIFLWMAYHDRIQCGVQLKKRKWSSLANCNL